MGGHADAAAPLGLAGTLLLDPKNLVIDDNGGIYPQYQLIDPNPSSGNYFGFSVVVLSNGNVVVASPHDGFGASSAGAVYLFNGETGALISTLTGSQANDYVGIGGITALSNGSYVVRSLNWANGTATYAGAVTWGSGTSGVSGVVSQNNSLVGSQANDQVGIGGITALSNGSYVVRSQYWANGAATYAGAVTWGSGTSGVSGVVSQSNSLVGSQANDYVGIGGITALSTGDYVVDSYNWANGTATYAGAVTWGSGTSGVSGVVSQNNSLVGSQANDQVGSGGITALSNGDYVVDSYNWANGTTNSAGAVTWGSGTSGVSGVVLQNNSLVGSHANDQVGSGGITALSTGDYVVDSYNWANGTANIAGAVTWGSGMSGVSGIVSQNNSLVGSQANDEVGSGGITALSTGNYVVRSQYWANGAATYAGAVTWGSGTSGVSGVVSQSNSLVGSQAGDVVGSSGITALSKGNYVVDSPYWANGTATHAGAVTWGSGTSGVSGVVSQNNSLIGSQANDYVGIGGITALSNGDYVVDSYNWANGTTNSAGAVTWGSGMSGVSGIVSQNNSLIGSQAYDNVGVGGITALSKGNYVVDSPYWANGTATHAGAVTWGSGTSGVSGVVSQSNSLVGSQANDYVGIGGITALSTGDYVVDSYNWANGTANIAGAVTWGSGMSGVSGIVSQNNSLVGSQANDEVGSGGITALSTGNYVVRSQYWANGAATYAGAVTWGSGTSGVSGVVSQSNSLVGSQAGDVVGVVITALSNGNYVVRSYNWANGAATYAGAVTWGSGTSGVSGVVSQSNSLVGSQANDRVGNGIAALSNGNYVVSSSNWANGMATNAGAVTWGSGTSGVSGVVSQTNSLVGSTAGAYLSYRGELSAHAFLAASALDGGGGKVYVGLRDINALTFGRAQSQTVTLTSQAVTSVLSAGTNVTLQANNNITINSDLIANNTSGDGGNLFLEAGRSIFQNANIATDNGNLTFVANETLANGVVDSERDAGTAVITMGTGTSIDAGAGAVSISLLDGAGKTNTGAGAITLGTISADSIDVANQGASGGNDLLLSAGGVLTASGNGDAIVLAANGAFTNNAGSSALSLTGGGRWLVYSSAPGTDTFGNLDSGNTAIWDATFASLPPASVTADGNRYLFAEQPVLTITTTDVSRTYGEDASIAVSMAYAVSGYRSGVTGAFLADDQSNVYSGEPMVDSAYAGFAPAVPVGGGAIPITATTGSLRALNGYAFSFVNSGRSTLLPAHITVTATGGTSTYGDAPSDPGFTASGLQNHEDVTVLTGLSNSFGITASTDAGDHTLTVAGTLTNGNYVVDGTTNATWTVNKAQLTYVADAATKTYGDANPTFSGTVTGFVNSDTLSSGATSGTLTWSSLADKTTGAGTAAISGSGLSAANYTFVQASGNATALTIDKAQLTYVADAATKTYGDANPTFSGTVTGFVNSDTLSSGATSGTLTWSSLADKTTGAGTAAISGSGLSAANYTFVQASGNATALTIDKAQLTYVADAATKTYGDANPTFSGTVTGFVNSDTLSSGATSGTLTWSSLADKTTGAGTAAINGSGLTAANYTFVQASGNATALTIDKAQLIASLTGVVEKTYDGNTIATLTASNYSLAGIVGTDAVTLNAPTNGSYDTPDVGTGKIVSVTGLALFGAASGNYALLSTSIADPVGIIDAVTTTGTSNPTTTGTSPSQYNVSSSGGTNGGNNSSSSVNITFQNANNSNTPMITTVSTQTASNTNQNIATSSGPGSLLAPFSQFDPNEYANDTLPGFASQGSEAAVLTMIARAEEDSHQSPPISALWNGNVASWPSNDNVLKHVSFSDGNGHARTPHGNNGFTFTEGATDIVGMLQHGPVMLGGATSTGQPPTTPWLLATDMTADGKGIIANDPLTGDQVVLAYDPATKTVGGVTAVIDPKTGKPVPLGNGAPNLTGQKTKVPDVVWSELKAFTPKSYFAVSI